MGVLYDYRCVLCDQRCIARVSVSERHDSQRCQRCTERTHIPTYSAIKVLSVPGWVWHPTKSTG